MKYLFCFTWFLQCIHLLHWALGVGTGRAGHAMGQGCPCFPAAPGDTGGLLKCPKVTDSDVANEYMT